MKSRIMYIEQKQADHNDNGPARIGRVNFSKTGRMIYYQGTAFQSLKGTGICANYFDVESREEYRILGPKKNGEDRHWAASGKVEIDEDVREEYLPQSNNAI